MFKKGVAEEGCHAHVFLLIITHTPLPLHLLFAWVRHSILGYSLEYCIKVCSPCLECILECFTLIVGAVYFILHILFDLV